MDKGLVIDHIVVYKFLRLEYGARKVNDGG